MTIVSKQLSNLRGPNLCGPNLPAPAPHTARPIPLWIANWASGIGTCLQAGGEGLGSRSGTVLINTSSMMPPFLVSFVCWRLLLYVDVLWARGGYHNLGEVKGPADEVQDNRERCLDTVTLSVNTNDRSLNLL
jgi:hypothetical protein